MSATTSVRFHEWAHDVAQNRSAEMHTKMGDFRDTEKGVFLEGRRREEKISS